MHTIDEMITELIRVEGGFTDDKRDRAHYGKAKPPQKWDCYCTNKGITQATLSEWLGRQASIEEVRALDDETAAEIYELRYFRAPRIDTLPTAIQPQVFDCSVNHGQRQAIKFVQGVINQAGFGPVDADGVLGPQSRKAAERAQAEMGAYFNNAIAEERLAFYDSLIARDPSQKRFERGWKARANSFRMEVPS
jgi:lysozyme family protein